MYIKIRKSTNSKKKYLERIIVVRVDYQPSSSLVLLLQFQESIQMKTLKPKQYIKMNQKTEKYECTICNYITEKPYVCRGRCSKMFCFQCINCIKRNNNQCPYRCSKPFDLIQCPEIQLEFYCPFEPKSCEYPILSLNSFEHHSEVCKFTPPTWKQKEENFRKYRCEKGHDLFFLDQDDLRKLYGWAGFYDAPVNSTCSLCSQKSLCRSICPKCSENQKNVLYCTNCRKPPCTKKTCLYSHPLKKEFNTSKGLICDFCGTAAYLLGPNAFRDIKCNFDICQVCFENLPETHELVPFTIPKSAISHLHKKEQSINSHRNLLLQRLFAARNYQVQLQHQQSQQEQQQAQQYQEDEQEDNVDINIGEQEQAALQQMEDLAAQLQEVENPIDQQEHNQEEEQFVDAMQMQEQPENQP